MPVKRVCACFFQCDFYCWYPLCIHLLGQASSEKPCGHQEQSIVNKVCIQLEYITKVRYVTHRLKFQSTYHYLYINKRTVAPTDLYWRRKQINRDHCWHHIPWKSQNGLKRSCVCHPFTYGQFATACALSTFGGDNGRVVVRRPHGGRTITCHYLALLCDLTSRKQVFEHFQNLVLNLRSLAITLVIAEMPNVCRTFTYVYLRSLAITCRNHS